jgi:hypothetical protein
MAHEFTNQDLQERATYRRAHSDYGIGAALDRDITEPDRNGRVWRLKVTDTMHGYGFVKVVLARARRDREFEPEVIEQAVERLSGNYPREVRMQSLVLDPEHNGPLTIRLRD